MTFLALDPGRKRVGVAISHGILAEAMAVLQFREGGFEVFYSQLEKIIVSQSVDKIIVGVPMGKDQKKSKQTEWNENFILQLKKYTSIPVEVIEESFSTTSAYERGADKRDVDSQAAKIILEQYLNEKN